MAKKSKDDIRFEVDQLRKDKVIYAVESSAMSLIALVLYFYVPVVFREILTEVRYQESITNWFGAVLFVTVAYWVYTAIGNMVRLRKIKALEKKL